MTTKPANRDSLLLMQQRFPQYFQKKKPAEERQSSTVTSSPTTTTTPSSNEGTTLQKSTGVGKEVLGSQTHTLSSSSSCNGTSAALPTLLSPYVHSPRGEKEMEKSNGLMPLLAHSLDTGPHVSGGGPLNASSSTTTTAMGHSINYNANLGGNSANGSSTTSHPHHLSGMDLKLVPAPPPPPSTNTGADGVGSPRSMARPTLPIGSASSPPSPSLSSSAAPMAMRVGVGRPTLLTPPSPLPAPPSATNTAMGYGSASAPSTRVSSSHEREQGASGGPAPPFLSIREAGSEGGGEGGSGKGGLLQGSGQHSFFPSPNASQTLPSQETGTGRRPCAVTILTPKYPRGGGDTGSPYKKPPSLGGCQLLSPSSPLLSTYAKKRSPILSPARGGTAFPSATSTASTPLHPGEANTSSPLHQPGVCSPRQPCGPLSSSSTEDGGGINGGGPTLPTKAPLTISAMTGGNSRHFGLPNTVLGNKKAANNTTAGGRSVATTTTGFSTHTTGSNTGTTPAALQGPPSILPTSSNLQTSSTLNHSTSNNGSSNSTLSLVNPVTRSPSPARSAMGGGGAGGTPDNGRGIMDPFGSGDYPRTVSPPFASLTSDECQTTLASTDESEEELANTQSMDNDGTTSRQAFSTLTHHDGGGGIAGRPSGKANMNSPLWLGRRGEFEQESATDAEKEAKKKDDSDASDDEGDEKRGKGRTSAFSRLKANAERGNAKRKKPVLDPSSPPTSSPNSSLSLGAMPAGNPLAAALLQAMRRKPQGGGIGVGGRARSGSTGSLVGTKELLRQLNTTVNAAKGGSETGSDSKSLLEKGGKGSILLALHRASVSSAVTDNDSDSDSKDGEVVAKEPPTPYIASVGNVQVKHRERSSAVSFSDQFPDSHATGHDRMNSITLEEGRSSFLTWSTTDVTFLPRVRLGKQRILRF